MHQNKKKASPPKNWRGKGNVREADKARPVFNARMKAVGWGCLIAVAVGGILLCLLSILMAGGKVPIWAIKGIGLVVGCVMAAVAAFCCARFSRQDGFFLGLLFSLIGAFVGTTISFYLAKLLGRDAMHLLFTEEKMNWFVEKLNSRKAYTIVFLIYLIPGLPKDIMSYAAGISSMNFKAFLIFSMIGRTPAMSGSLLIGALYFSGHYGIMIAIGVFAVAAFVLCIVFRKQISNYIDKLYEKVTED